MLELGMREIIAQAAAAAETDCEPGSRTFAGGFTRLNVSVCAGESLSCAAQGTDSG